MRPLPRTRTVSPGRISTSRSPLTTVPSGSMKEPSSKETLSGSFVVPLRTLLPEMRRYWANPPGAKLFSE